MMYFGSRPFFKMQRKLLSICRPFPHPCCQTPFLCHVIFLLFEVHVEAGQRLTVTDFLDLSSIY